MTRTRDTTSTSDTTSTTETTTTRETTADRANGVSSRDRGGIGAARAWTTTGVAVGLALLTWVALVPVAGVDVRVAQTGGGTAPVGAVGVGLAALVAGLVAWPVAAGFRRHGSSRRTWLGACAAVLLVSLVGPSAATTAGAGAVLAALHLLVGTAVAVGYGRRWPGRVGERAGAGGGEGESVSEGARMG